MPTIIRNTFIICAALLIAGTVQAQQNLTFVRVSPHAVASQDVGFANITVDYSRPGVKGREIWGKLVPYGLAPNPFGNGKPMPWRAGANENTTFTISHDAMINGQNLAAGTYSLHVIPQEKEWTIIFNKNYQAWGSFFYDENQDALRIRVVPQQAPHQEWLQYGFEELTSGSARVYLRWEKLKAVFEVKFDEHQITLGKYRNELSNLAGFNQAAWGQAANYCVQNNINLDEAMQWIDNALAMNGGENFSNLSLKADLLIKKGKNEEGEALKAKALQIASEAELNQYGYKLLGAGQLDEAIKIFGMNIKRHPDSWNVYDSLAEALAQKGDKAGAKKNYQKALKMAPEVQHKRINEAINAL